MDDRSLIMDEPDREETKQESPARSEIEFAISVQEEIDFLGDILKRGNLSGRMSDLLIMQKMSLERLIGRWSGEYSYSWYFTDDKKLGFKRHKVVDSKS